MGKGRAPELAGYDALALELESQLLASPGSQIVPLPSVDLP